MAGWVAACVRGKEGNQGSSRGWGISGTRLDRVLSPPRRPRSTVDSTAPGSSLCAPLAVDMSACLSFLSFLSFLSCLSFH